jgi:hypothetical protein
MYENEKMRLVETILAMEKGKIKNDGEGEFVRNLVNVRMYPQ